MKKLKILLACLCGAALLLTGCKKEENFSVTIISPTNVTLAEDNTFSVDFAVQPTDKPLDQEYLYVFASSWSSDLESPDEMPKFSLVSALSKGEGAWTAVFKADNPDQITAVVTADFYVEGEIWGTIRISPKE